MLDFHFESPFWKPICYCLSIIKPQMCHDKSIGQLSVIGGWTDKQQVTCCYCCWVKKTALPLLSTQPHDTFLERSHHKIQSETSKANLIDSRTAPTTNLLPSFWFDRVRSPHLPSSSHYSISQESRPTDGGGSVKIKIKQDSTESHLSYESASLRRR